MSYPASLQIDTPERIANWRPLVQWLLAIPHLVVLGVLGTVSTVVVIVGWFAVVLTGRLPAGIAGLQAMYLRYGTVVNAYGSFLTTQYPPFNFDTSPADPGGSQAAANFSPALDGRNRLTVLFRAITLIPSYIFTVVIGIVGRSVSFSASSRCCSQAAGLPGCAGWWSERRRSTSASAPTACC